LSSGAIGSGALRDGALGDGDLRDAALGSGIIGSGVASGRAVREQGVNDHVAAGGVAVSGRAFGEHAAGELAGNVRVEQASDSVFDPVAVSSSVQVGIPSQAQIAFISGSSDLLLLSPLLLFWLLGIGAPEEKHNRESEELRVSHVVGSVSLVLCG